jgi:hypothetical protein
VKNEFLELKTTDNQVVWIRKHAVEALEEQPGTARAPGHTKVYVGAFKFLVVDHKPQELVAKIQEG